MLPSPLCVLGCALRCFVDGALSDVYPISQPPTQQLADWYTEGLPAQIEYCLFKRGHHRLGQLSEIDRQSILAYPGVQGLRYELDLSSVSNVGETCQSLAGSNLNDAMQGALVFGLAVYIVGPPALSLRDTGDVEYEACDFHACLFYLWSE